VADKSQDVELISGSEADGITKIRFYRKLVTCDDEDRNIDVRYFTITSSVVAFITPQPSAVTAVLLPTTPPITSGLSGP